MKIIEWNINQRSGNMKRGYDKKIPMWVGNIITEQDADIVVLTEFYKGEEWEKFKQDTFKDYCVFYSMNPADQNDILIAVKNNKEILMINTLYSSRENIPNFIRVDINYDDDILSIIGIRIRMVDSKYRYKEMEYAMDYIKNINNHVIVAGDFNNYRRGTVDTEWNMKELDKLFGKNFIRFTPSGSSIYEEKAISYDYEFAEDHFFSKGINIKVEPYYRDFVNRDTNIYKWGKDFQIYLGKDKDGKNQYDSIPAPFPDHAILIGEF